MFRSLISLILALCFAVLGTVRLVSVSDDYSFSVDTSSLGDVIGNKASNMNVWEMGTSFYDVDENTNNGALGFVEYIQLMQCSGGNAQRDLFKDPYDMSVTDDYDFTRLIENCRGILRMGAKPTLKLGSVPMKFTADYEFGGFETNIYPPDDYDVYYNYIAALARSLVGAFGKDELLLWHYGVMTEYENDDWFMSKSGDPEQSAKDYCKLYDYTVAALEDEIGEVYVGAHSMSVTEGLWDEELFIKHCAEGVNYKTGEKGSRLCYLSASFYDSKPGKFTSGKTLPQTINDLRACAEKYGLFSLDYGIDEGRIYSGTVRGADKSELPSRSVGYTWQAAYDARMYAQMIDNDIDYFSAWSYHSGGMLSGNPTVSYHTAQNISRFDGAKKAAVSRVKKGAIPGAEINLCAAYNENDETLHIMAYNFKNKLNYKRSADIKTYISAPQLGDGNLNVTEYMINDDCNFFDEWCEDREKYGIDDSCFSWSPQDGCVSGNLKDPGSIEIYNELYSKYSECSVLTPVTYQAQVKDGKIELDTTLDPSAVIFYEIRR